MNLLEVILGQIPEAIYFTIFILLVKELKSKRIIFTMLMIIEYLLLWNVLPYSIWSYVLYFVLSFIVMKILYKDKSNITDVFTLGIASIILIICCFIPYIIIWFTIKNMLLYVIITRICTFGVLFIFRHKLHNINNLYKKLWNRGKHTYKMKSTTFRALNLVVFNLSFVVINLGVIFYYCWR